MLLWLVEGCWKPFNSLVILAAPEKYSTATTDVWIDALSLLEKLTSLKFLYFLFDSPLTVQETATCRGSALLKFQSSSCFSAQVCLFCLLKCFGAETDGGKFHSIWNYYIPSCIPHRQIPKQISSESSATLQFSVYSCFSGIELTVGVTSKKAHAPCTEG